MPPTVRDVSEMEPSLGSEVEDVGAEGVGVVGTPTAVQLGDLSERLGLDHLAFEVDTETELFEWQAHLARHGVR